MPYIGQVSISQKNTYKPYRIEKNALRLKTDDVIIIERLRIRAKEKHIPLTNAHINIYLIMLEECLKAGCVDENGEFYIIKTGTEINDLCFGAYSPNTINITLDVLKKINAIKRKGRGRGKPIAFDYCVFKK